MPQPPSCSPPGKPPEVLREPNRELYFAPPPPRVSGTLLFCLAFAAGLLPGRYFHLSLAVWLAVAALLLVVAGLIRRIGFNLPAAVLLICATVSLGAGWFVLRINRLPADSLSSLLPGGMSLVRLQGSIESEPYQAQAQVGEFAAFAYEQPVTRFTLRVSSLLGRDGSMLPVTGRLNVRVDEVTPGLHAGDRLRVLGMFHPLAAPANPGENDQRLYGRERNLAGRLRVTSRANIEHLPVVRTSWSAGDALMRRMLALRARLRRSASSWLLAGAFDQQQPHTLAGRALVQAIVLGERGRDAQAVTGAFRRVGLSHLLAISGLHLAILALVTAGLARIFTSSRRVEALVVTLAILSYLLLVPARTPVIRAAVMVLGFVLAEATGRRYDRVAVLSLVALVILLWRPLELWSPGFQLSFGIVAGLMILNEPLRSRWFGPRPDPETLRIRDRLVEGGKSLIVGSLLAWGLATPLVAYHFGVFCPLAPLLGLIVLPPAALILVVGYLKVLTGALFPSLALFTGPVLTVTAETLAGMVIRVDALPFSSVKLPYVSPAWTIFATAAVVFLVLHTRRLRIPALAAVFAAFVWLFINPGPGSPFMPGRDSDLRLDVLSVGDGTCILLRSGKQNMIWDCGSGNLMAVGPRVIIPALHALGVNHLDTIVISHPNLDHYLAAPDLVRDMQPARLLITDTFLDIARRDTDGPVAYLLDRVGETGVSIREMKRGDTETFGRCRLTWLHPLPGELYPGANESSQVLRVETATRRVLLCGDIAGRGIAELLEGNDDLSADVMEIPHHGSVNYAARELLHAVNPSFVMQSTSNRRNPDDWGEDRQGRNWLSTSLTGAFYVEIKKDGRIIAGPLLTRD